MAGPETQIGRGAKVAIVDDDRGAKVVPTIFSDGDGPFRCVNSDNHGS